MSAASVRWRLQGPELATLSCGPLQGFVKPHSNGMNFLACKWNQATITDMQLLGYVGRPELQLSDFYVRQSDLVADFASSGTQRIAPQLYWRAALLSPSVVALEHVISVRTDLLDSSPTWVSLSCVNGAGLWHTANLSRPAFKDISGRAGSFERTESREHLFVFRQPSIGLSYAEMVHPTDFVIAESPDAEQPTTILSTLFPERLEKGVIRRGRVCGWFLPVENDLNAAVELARQFVDEPLPLTA